MIRSDQLFEDKENSMDNYIFLTDEGYTFMTNSESDVPDIENLQVIGISNGNNEKEAFYKTMNHLVVFVMMKGCVEIKLIVKA
ncbi:hypothetical protein [Clostridium sp.]|uniref:hypothetical protein n=1 Tax=Clostridium sp. TaxID=1506 RepID=UPI003D6C84C9